MLKMGWFRVDKANILLYLYRHWAAKIDALFWAWLIQISWKHFGIRKLNSLHVRTQGQSIYRAIAYCRAVKIPAPLSRAN